jgi:hypothetical protein
MNLKDNSKRVVGDAIFILLSIIPAAISFYTDFIQITHNAFPRFGAIMAIFAAFLEFRTHEISTMKKQDQFNALWRSIINLVEVMVMQKQVEKNADLEKLKQSLSNFKDISPAHYRYNTLVSLLGKVLVVSGTLIWAFGDCILGCDVFA